MANNTQYGLTTGDNTPVPLKKLEVKTEIQGFISSTSYTLTYENEEDKPVEASFVFPMDDSSAIFHFEAEIDGRRIVAECQDKEQAKQTYDDAMEAGQSAFLLAESDQSRDIFKCDIGNLPPHKAALVKFSYVTELETQATGALLYVFPVTLFGRYELTRPEDTTSNRPSKRIKLPRAKDGQIPYELDFNIKVLSPREIIGVTFVDERDQNEAQLNKGKEGNQYFAEAGISGNFHWDHDVSIKILYSDPFQPHVVTEKGRADGEGILKHDMVMLNFFPNLEGEETRFAKAELLFVMDRSGSMGGESMKHAREALLECLKIIPEECIFNIISFGSTFQKLFPASQPANENKLNTAQADVRKMEANLGGTEILTPLRDIMEPKDTIDEYPRQVFLFTDGGVSDSDGVISFIKENTDSTRVFTFGIGQGVSTSLVKGAAHAGKGKCVMVKDTKDLASQAAQTLKCAMQPNVDDVSIIFAPKVEATFFPSTLPPIFNGERLIAYAVLTDAKKAEMVASLKGKINSRLIYHSLNFSLKDPASELAPVHRLAAKAAIKQMEEDETWNNPKKAEIIVMSTAANVISKYTAFVGVDNEGPKMQEPSVQRPLPVPAPASHSRHAYGGASANSAMGGMYMAKAQRMSMPMVQCQAASMMSRPQLMADCGIAEAQSTSKKMKKRSRFLAEDTLQCNVDSVLDRGEALLDEDELEEKAIFTMKEKIPAKEDELEKKEIFTMKEKIPAKEAPCCFIPQLECNSVDQEMEESPYYKEYQPCRVTECVLFAPWKKGAWYPVQGISSSSYSKYEATFRDGCKMKVQESNIISAELLSVGDMVGLRKNDTDFYDTAVILEYNKELDSFVLVRHDGQVEWSTASDMMIPARLAEKVKIRTGSSSTNVVMCTLNEQGQNAITLTTSDISELREDGWITNHVVNFFTSYLKQEVLSADELRATHIFPVEFSAGLFAEEDYVKFGRMRTIHILYDKVWPWLRRVNLKEKLAMFVPVFDEIHWYLIVVHLNDKMNQGNGKSTRISFEIMDSYYQYTEHTQIHKLSGVLKMLAQEQNLEAEVASTAIQRNTPLQINENDCGICMLQCLIQCYKDDLAPNPTLDWYDQGSNLRNDISRIAMKLYWQQRN